MFRRAGLIRLSVYKSLMSLNAVNFSYNAWKWGGACARQNI